MAENEWQTLDKFTRSYAETALWSSNDESGESGGDPVDKNYGIEDMAQETIEKMKADCAKFQDECSSLLEPFDLEQCGHDFWLTRNGHGAGFWDGDYPEEAGESLTQASKKFGECNLYVGDDGLIYCM